jgi:hypothetical protein
MSTDLVICIPGPWTDRSDFLRKVIVAEPAGRYMFAGMILADVGSKDHVRLDFCNSDPSIPRAFEIAGQDKIPTGILTQLKEHSSVVYLHFPLDLLNQRNRLLKFSEVIRRLGGIAVKMESAGIAHTWERWQTLLSGTLFDAYCSSVVLVGDREHYYSCGMHQFGLPDCEAPRSIPVGDAADLMNRFNCWQIAEQPKISTGHTFSLSPEAPRFRLSLENDLRHETESLFQNAHGIWRLVAV